MILRGARVIKKTIENPNGSLYRVRVFAGGVSKEEAAMGEDAAAVIGWF